MKEMIPYDAFDGDDAIDWFLANSKRPDELELLKTIYEKNRDAEMVNKEINQQSTLDDYIQSLPNEIKKYENIAKEFAKTIYSNIINMLDTNTIVDKPFLEKFITNFDTLKVFAKRTGTESYFPDRFIEKCEKLLNGSTPQAPGTTQVKRMLESITLCDYFRMKLSFTDGESKTITAIDCPGCRTREGEENRWKIIIEALQGNELNEKQKYRVNDTFRTLLSDDTFSLWKNGKLDFPVKLPARHETFKQKSKREYKDSLPAKKMRTQERKSNLYDE